MDIAYFCKKRRTIQSQTLKLQSKVNSHEATPFSAVAAQVHLEKVKSLKIDCEKNHHDIAQLCTDEEYLVHERVFGDLEDKLANMQIALMEIIKSDTHSTHSSSKTIQSEIRLPKIELPSFNGDLNEWTAFKDLFNVSVHNNSKLSNAQKLTYLKSSLTGSAAKLLNSLAPTDANYIIAWKALEDRFQNERELVFSILKRFTGQPKIVGDSATALRSMVDVSKECLRSLEALLAAEEHRDAMLIFLMLQKVDATTRQFWELSLTDTAVPKLDQFLEFLEQRARTLASGGICKISTQAMQQDQNITHAKRAFVHHTSQSNCKVCAGSHPLFKCSVFLTSSVQDRRDAVKRHGLCFNCLHAGHSAAKCDSKWTCKSCKEKHNTLLHIPKPAATLETESTTVKSFHSSQVGLHANQGMLATALVKIWDKMNQPHLCRALLDGGSTSSFITESCIKKIGLTKNQTTAEVSGMASANIGTVKGSTTTNISPYFHTPGGESFVLTMLILPHITTRLPTESFNSDSWIHLKNIQLADPEYEKPSNIDILLGSDIFWDLLLDGKKNGPPGTPTGIRSKLGWLVAGNLSLSSPKILVHHVDVNLDARLQQFWELETVQSKCNLTKEEESCEKHFNDTTKRNANGSYIVSLPFKSSEPALGNSREIAFRRLKSLERRLANHAFYKKEYISFMKEYLDLGHMAEVSKTISKMKDESIKGGNGQSSYYIPHHFVLKDSSTTTKFRVVFDASAQTSSGSSLNSKLMVGPTIQDSLVSLLMRFRTHIVAFVADIAKMYRRILVEPSFTDFQRILWREDPKEEVKEFRLLTVTYGTASAPFHATRVLNQLAKDEERSLPLASAIAQRDFYVDDLMSGVDSLEIALQIQAELIELTRRGGFQLRKWYSNHPSLLSSLPADFRGNQLPLTIDRDESTKTLGIHWNPVTDSFAFKVNLPHLMPGVIITKRTMLSEMSKVFDPLGWLAPVMVRAKIQFQQLWKMNIGWDDSLPPEIYKAWTRYRHNLHHIEELSIKRCMIVEGAKNITLHGFSDASELAYYAVIYLHAEVDGREPVISIVSSKTRVAPSKTVSLPKLELCGALLLSRLMTTVQDSLRLEISNIYSWTDSTTVLAWLKGHPSQWHTFVANRVSEIQDGVSTLWGHVGGNENPADCASRGIDPAELSNHLLWWDGPSWLRSNYLARSNKGFPFDSTLVDQERKKIVIAATVTVDIDIRFLQKCSSLTKLQRVTAWCFRFIDNCKSKIQKRKNPNFQNVLSTNYLSSEEINLALLAWVRVVQAVEFRAEICCIQKKLQLASSSRLRFLNPFIDSQKVLRVGGRLSKASLPAEQRTPIPSPYEAYHPI